MQDQRRPARPCGPCTMARARGPSCRAAEGPDESPPMRRQAPAQDIGQRSAAWISVSSRPAQAAGPRRRPGLERRLLVSRLGARRAPRPCPPGEKGGFVRTWSKLSARRSAGRAARSASTTRRMRPLACALRRASAAVARLTLDPVDGRTRHAGGKAKRGDACAAAQSAPLSPPGRNCAAARNTASVPERKPP